MWGISESREPIKGEFAKKIIEEVAKIREQQMKKDYISNEKFENEVRERVHNIVMKDENYSRWLTLMQLPLEDILLEDLQWASEQPYNSLSSKNIFLAEIERRK
jgi:hypothetical protein